MTLRLRRLFRRRQVEAEMAEEIRFHLQQRAADYAADGMPALEAEAAARRKFGNLGSIESQAREAFGWRWVERMVHDGRLAVRRLAGAPGFTILAVLTLALGIGLNTAMFSVVNSIVIKPLPYPGANQLDRIYRTTPQDAEDDFSRADFLDLQRDTAGYGSVAAYSTGEAGLSEPGRHAEIRVAARVTANFFSLLGVQPQRGRGFLPEESTPGREHVVVLSERCWLNGFGGRSDIVGRTIRVDGAPNVVVGILPSSFDDMRHLGMIDVFRPFAWDQKEAANRTHRNLRVIGRRSPGTSRADGTAFIASIGARLARRFPQVNAGAGWRVVSLDESVKQTGTAEIVKMLVALSAFVLAIACSNLANLLLVRTFAQARELAVRSALGASRLQLLRPLIAEAILLAVAGGAGALLLARWAGDWLSARSVNDSGERLLFGLDWHVFGWALVLSLLTAAVFGLAPALFTLRLDLNGTLKSGGRGATTGRGSQRFARLLIVGQFALSMVLLACAALYIRGLRSLYDRRSGYDTSRVTTATILLPTTRYHGAARITAFQRVLLDRLRSLPGVDHASLSSAFPFYTWSHLHRFVVEGEPPPDPAHEPVAVVNSVSPGYFETYGTRLVAGRRFTGADSPASRPVFIIGESMAHGLFGDKNPIGRHLVRTDGTTRETGEIVGIVSDVVPVDPRPGSVRNQLYVPIAQAPDSQINIAVCAYGVPASQLIETIRGTVTALDPDLPVRTLMTADARIRRALYELDILRDMLTGFALLGLGLATLGIYGVISRTMAQRRNEFAIRYALGAALGDIRRIVLASGARLALIGAAVGMVGAAEVARFLASVLPAIPFNQPPALAGSTALLIAVALAASWLPARQASRVDPNEALRAE